MANDPRFRTTRWTLILAARSDDARSALAELCELYWYPLYVFLRRSGHEADAARDLTQGFFLQLLERNDLESVRPEAGRFRSYLLAALKHYLANQRRAAAAEKRGGGVTPLSLDIDDAERRYRNEPADGRTPDQAYERRWALAVLGRVDRGLGEELRGAGKGEQHRLLAPHVTGRGTLLPYADIAGELDASEAAVKMAISRLRKRFGKLLRQEIGETVEAEQVDAEVRHLLEVLR